jgi:hypothetical protein
MSEFKSRVDTLRESTTFCFSKHLYIFLDEGSNFDFTDMMV